MEIQTHHVNRDPGTGSQEVVSTRRTLPSREAREEETAVRTTAWVWYVVGVLEVLLALRVVFLLLGAGVTGFTSFLYGVTRPFVLPFQGIFPAAGVETGYFDSAAVLAMLIYSLLGWGIAALVDTAKRPRP